MTNHSDNSHRSSAARHATAPRLAHYEYGAVLAALGARLHGPTTPAGRARPSERQRPLRPHGGRDAGGGVP
jgi:hypothetical protein